MLTGELAHGNNPVLRWMAGNVIARTDENGNLWPDKARSRGRIDGIVAFTVFGLRQLLIEAGTKIA